MLSFDYKNFFSWKNSGTFSKCKSISSRNKCSSNSDSTHWLQNSKSDAGKHPQVPTTSNHNNDSDCGDEDPKLIEDLSAITNPLPEFDPDKVLDDAPEGNSIKLDYASNDKLSLQSQNDLCEVILRQIFQ